MNLNNIFIVGLMGSGKTSIGKLLAKRTGKLFIDTDNEIIKESGMTITEIFNKFGENYFRDLEHKVLSKVKSIENHVISTGGGVILKLENIKIMKNSGTIIFLDIDVETQLSRVKNKKNRPLLDSNNMAENLVNIKKDRDYIYKNISDYIISISGKNKSEIVGEIQNHIS
jgi:shikimate kinase